jgi:allantoinase
MEFSGRAPFVPAPQRERLRLPNGARLAVHVIVNVEDWAYHKRLPRSVLTAPGGFEPIPDVPNFAWYSYGLRVGIWRMLELFSGLNIRPTLSLNASVCDAYPAIVEATERAGWEIMAHGYNQVALPASGDERTVIRDSLKRIEQMTHKRPRGWLGPGLVESFETADILAEEGLEYCCDWGAADDLPYEIEVASGKLLSVPYPVEMNDIVIFGIEKRPDDAMIDRGLRHFQCLYRESETQAKVMAVALHPWISGVPHRVDYLAEMLRSIASYPGVTFMSGGEITDWYRSATVT